VPHGVSGVQGRPFPSPFADPPGVGMSSPTVNVAWSAANAVAGVLVLRRGVRTRGEGIAVAVGAIAMAAGLAFQFGSVMAGGTGLRRRRGGASGRPVVQRAFEPVAKALAGTRWMPLWAVVHHRGRRSGTAFQTPIAIVPAGDPGLILISLPWGRDTNWARNVVAAGGATLTWRGRDIRLVDPRIVDGAEAASVARAPFGAVMERMPAAIVMRRG
jgi:deazaflavin-dependent oxidoreductase (nitroreductase family)